MPGRIAIHLSNDASCIRRIETGLQLAKNRDAAVVGVYPTDGIASYYYHEQVLPQEARTSLKHNQDKDKETTRQLFLDKAQEAGVAAQWRAPDGDADQALAQHARYSDLIIMSKTPREEARRSLAPNLPESVVMAAGRPVLLLPNAGPINSIGERILYCWDQRREAARAFTDAAPMLKSCQELVVLEVDRDQAQFNSRDLHDDDFTNYCISLGYPTPRHIVQHSDGLGVGHIILNTASDYSSDLIVMGAYGHSRMRQWVMGGASRTLLESMTVPVLMAQ